MKGKYDKEEINVVIPFLWFTSKLKVLLQNKGCGYKRIHQAHSNFYNEKAKTKGLTKSLSSALFRRKI